MKTICVHRINSNGLSVGGDEYYCYDEKRYNLNKCDIICTNRSTLPFVVQYVSILTSSGENIKVPKLTIFSINGVATTSTFNNNNMETRTVKVSIEQARCWFNGNNQALKELALTVYSEQELTLSYESIKLQLGDNNLTTTCVTVPYEEHDKFDVNAKLCLMAKYFNGDWKRTLYNKGYFIGQSKQGFTTSRDMGNSLGICVHETVVYAGIVYFKDEESAIKAFKMLTELDKEILFG